MSSNTMTKPKIAESSTKVRMMAQIAMLTAVAEILMLFEIPLPFAPSFYEIDLSEVPVLIGCFAMGPMAGVAIEALKILLNFLINGTMTAGIGEIANFAIGCAMVLPAALIYQHRKSRKNALIGMMTGTVVMTAVGGLLNAFVLLPVYAAAFGGMDAIIRMGTAVNGNITGLESFVLFAVVPFNLLKGIVVSAAAFLLYKRVSRILIHHI
jgi:riboflavin transporter FmnP